MYHYQFHHYLDFRHRCDNNIGVINGGQLVESVRSPRSALYLYAGVRTPRQAVLHWNVSNVSRTRIFKYVSESFQTLGSSKPIEKLWTTGIVEIFRGFQANIVRKMFDEKNDEWIISVWIGDMIERSRIFRKYEDLYSWER